MNETTKFVSKQKKKSYCDEIKLLKNHGTERVKLD